MYTVKILPPEEFDKLPFERAREALGAANAKTGIAYVRDTGYNDITKHTIEHELDELMQSVSPHEENGIRYKIPLLGPLLTGAKALGGAAIGGAKALGGAALKGAASVGNFLTPGPAIFGQAAKAAPGALTGALSGASAPLSSRGGLGFGSSLPGFSSGSSGINTGAIAGGGLRSAASGNIFSNFGNSLIRGAIPAAQSASQSGILGNLFSGAKNLIGQAFAPQPGQFPGTPPISEQQGSGTILDQFKKALPGAAVSLLGNLFAGKPEVPDFSGITDPLRARIEGQSGISPAFDLGFGEAKRTIDAPLGEVPEEVFGQSEKLRNQQLTDDLTQLRSQFKALNPTADVDNNSAYLREKSRLEERAREDKANARAATSFEFTNQELGRRLTTMQTLLNLDQAQTSQLIQLAQLDVAEIMMKTGLEVEEANQIKQLFGGFGEILMRSQLPQLA